MLWCTLPCWFSTIVVAHVQVRPSLKGNASVFSYFHSLISTPWLSPNTPFPLFYTPWKMLLLKQKSKLGPAVGPHLLRGHLVARDVRKSVPSFGNNFGTEITISQLIMMKLPKYMQLHRTDLKIHVIY